MQANPHCKILIIEDDPGISNFLKATVSAAGYDAIVTKDGKTALHLASDAGINQDKFSVIYRGSGMTGDQMNSEIILRSFSSENGIFLRILSTTSITCSDSIATMSSIWNHCLFRLFAG